MGISLEARVPGQPGGCVPLSRVPSRDQSNGDTFSVRLFGFYFNLSVEGFFIVVLFRVFLFFFFPWVYESITPSRNSGAHI